MELTFDTKIMDCNLAQAYLKENNEFESFGLCKYKFGLCGNWNVYNDNIEIIYTEQDLDDVYYEIESISAHAPAEVDKNTKFEILAIKLLENKELIAQLEFTIRGIPLKVTYAQIDLIVKQFKCGSNSYAYQILAVTDNSPLLAFGCIANLDRHHFWHLILVTKKTAIIFSLLIRLCFDVGLTNFYLIITTEQNIDNYSGPCELLDFRKATEQTLGTVGVITEHSDVESAVDIFLEAPTHTPWILQKIYVKESIHDRLKDIIIAKANVKKHQISETFQAEGVTKYSLKLDFINYQQKIFVFDTISSKYTPSNDKVVVVAIEAYRTTKELLTLLKSDNAFYLSLWANNIAEANEIAHAVNSSVVWLNNYAEFRGPDEACSFLYNVFRKTLRVKKDNNSMQLYKHWDSWNKLSIKERSRKLWEAIESYEKSGKALIVENDLTKLKVVLQNFNKNATIDIGNDYICTVIEKPVGIIQVPEMDDLLYNPEIIKAMLIGSALGFTVENENKGIFDKLGIPVMHVNFERGNDFVVTSKAYVQNKVIWSNFGTTFAN